MDYKALVCLPEPWFWRIFLLFAYWVVLYVFLFICDDSLQKASFRHTITVSKSLYPDPARDFARSDLGQESLQRLADDTSRQRGKENNQIGPSVHVTSIFT